MSTNFIALTQITISKSKQYFIDEAIKEALKSNLQMRHGCVLVTNGEIIARGHNMGYSGPLNSMRSTHAEIATLQNLGNYNNLKDATMYVVRISTQNGKIYMVNSHPCQDCLPKLLKCIRIHGLKQVYYSN